MLQIDSAIGQWLHW